MPVLATTMCFGICFAGRRAAWLPEDEHPGPRGQPTVGFTVCVLRRPPFRQVDGRMAIACYSKVQNVYSQNTSIGGWGRILKTEFDLQL